MTTPTRGPGGRFVAASRASADAGAKPERAKTAPAKSSAKASAAKAPSAKASKKAGPPKAASANVAPAADNPAPPKPAIASTSEGAQAESRCLSLFLLRHADAGDPATWAGDDAARPLSKKGRKQARALGAHLDDLRLGIDAIITSPRVRAADTAKAVGKELGVKPTRDDRLGGGFDPSGLRELLGGLDASVSNVVLVGHDPDFSTIASWLTDAPLALRKGAIVRIDLPSRGAVPGSGALRWLLPPDALRG